MKFSGKVDSGPANKRLHFGGYLDHRLGTGIVFLIRHYWEIVANAHSFILICQNDGGTGKTFFGGVMFGEG